VYSTYNASVCDISEKQPITS